MTTGVSRTIKTVGGEPFGTVTGIIATPDGALWLNELRGIICISPDEVNQAAQNPEHLVSYRIFDFLDGLPGGTQMNYTVSTAVEGSDGRLWFGTDNGLAWIDPAHITKNFVPPPVSIRSLHTDAKIYDVSADVLNLPQGTQSLRIDYTALSFSIPERVRFRYRLEGADKEWQDAGTRRQAFYNNLRPGNYRFRVIAANNDGVWNETGATLPFTIAPMFYQTNWFALFCLTLAGCLVWLGYKWRIYLVESHLHLQFEDRLAERTHIAQELHDTLLQGVFSASIQLDAVVEQLADDSPVKLRLTRVQQLTGQIMTDGRNTIKGLHSPSMDNSLALEKAFAKIKQDLDIREQIDFRIVTVGEPRPIHPVVRDEIYRFGREALINAFRHSKAEKIEVEIEYAAKYFRLLVRDEGCGIKPEILRSGREGHLGLSGMRECSERMGAKLKIRSRIDSGTEIELFVPQSVAFENFEKNSNGSLLKRFKNLFPQKAETRNLDEEQEK